MGGMGLISYRARMEVLEDILNGCRCLVALNGMDEDGAMRSEYKLFKEFDEEEVKTYAISRSEQTRVKLTKVKTYLLECKLDKEIQI